MIPSNFNYHKAQSVDDAIAVLKANSDAQLLAGGHSLIPAMKLRLNAPGILVDIGRLSELKFIRSEGGELIIGASSTHADIAASDMVRDNISMFAEAAGLIGDIQVRNMGTIGGSIAHADPAADWPALLLAADATIVAKSPKGERKISASDFFEGFFATALNPSEIITEIRVPIPHSGISTSYKKFVQPASRFAIVGCAVMTATDHGKFLRANVAFTGVSDTPFRDSGVEQALIGNDANAATIAAAAEKAAAGVDIMSDHFASEEYRLHLAKVYAQRAISATLASS